MLLLKRLQELQISKRIMLALSSKHRRCSTALTPQRQPRTTALLYVKRNSPTAMANERSLCYEPLTDSNLYFRPPVLEDLDAIYAIEVAGYPEDEAATREKVDFRIRQGNRMRRW